MCCLCVSFHDAEETIPGCVLASVDDVERRRILSLFFFFFFFFFFLFLTSPGSFSGFLAYWLTGLLACWLAGLLVCWISGLLAWWLTPSSWVLVSFWLLLL